MRNRNRPDMIRVLGYLMLGLLIAGFLAWRWELIPTTEAAPESIIVHGGLPVPDLETYRNLEDVDLVVRTVICECGANEPLGCYDAVTQTIITRVQQKGLTYKQVVLEPWQYSCWNSGIPAPLERLRDNPEEMLPIGYYRIIEDIVTNALSGAESQYAGIDHYFSSCLVSPPFWVSKFEFVTQIGCHRFYRSG